MPIIMPNFYLSRSWAWVITVYRTAIIKITHPRRLMLTGVHIICTVVYASEAMTAFICWARALASSIDGASEYMRIIGSVLDLRK